MTTPSNYDESNRKGRQTLRLSVLWCQSAHVNQAAARDLLVSNELLLFVEKRQRNDSYVVRTIQGLLNPRKGSENTRCWFQQDIESRCSVRASQQLVNNLLWRLRCQVQSRAPHTLCFSKRRLCSRQPTEQPRSCCCTKPRSAPIERSSFGLFRSARRSATRVRRCRRLLRVSQTRP